jgi:hypothetical protein
MDLDMGTEDFTIKMGACMMDSGSKTKCRDLVNYIISRVNLLMKASGKTISLQARASCTIKYQTSSKLILTIMILTTSTTTGPSIKV